MNDFEKAAKDAVDAAANSEQLALIAAVLQAQQLTQQQPAAPAPAAPQSSGGAAKWIGIGIGGSIFLVAFALSAIAVAITAVALTICLLVLRAMWQDIKPK
ncbi:hypothetical protein [Streptomyces sp. NPDC017520]|uniref:hypothetical protein n=1 Tax=Streptomyces sp. NPDC017520 TaxID=3364998 RepID=UPI003798E765